MLDAPEHDWNYYHSVTSDSDAEALRGLTTPKRFELYASLFNLIWNTRHNLPGDWQRLEQQRWQEKLGLRRRMFDAFKKLDEFRRERSTAKDAR